MSEPRIPAGKYLQELFFIKILKDACSHWGPFSRLVSFLILFHNPPETPRFIKYKVNNKIRPQQCKFRSQAFLIQDVATAGKNSAGVLTTSQLLHSPTAYCLWHYTNQHSLSSAGGKLKQKKKVHREAAQAQNPPYLGSFSLMSFPPASSLIFFKSTVPSLYLHPPLLLCPLIPLLPSPWAVPSVCLL